MMTVLIPAIFAFVLPVAAAVLWTKRTGASKYAYFAGAFCFLLFAMGLEQASHSFFLLSDNAVSRAIKGSPVLYVLYGCLAAGIFEETGRLFGFKLLLRTQNQKEVSAAYGIGHGGMEAILTLGTTYLMLSLARMGVSLGDAEVNETMREAAAAVTPAGAAWAMLERFTAMLLHIGLSVFVFAAAKRPGKKLLFPLAVLLHGLADVAVVMYQIGVITSIPLTELISLVFAVLILLSASYLYRRID